MYRYGAHSTRQFKCNIASDLCGYEKKIRNYTLQNTDSSHQKWKISNFNTKVVSPDLYIDRVTHKKKNFRRFLALSRSSDTKSCVTQSIYRSSDTQKFFFFIIMLTFGAISSETTMESFWIHTVHYLIWDNLFFSLQSYWLILKFHDRIMLWLIEFGKNFPVLTEHYF